MSGWAVLECKLCGAKSRIAVHENTSEFCFDITHKLECEFEELADKAGGMETAKKYLTVYMEKDAK